MSIAPLITIFVRHSADCKYAGDEFEKRCRCRKHFRWTQNGKQHRRKTGTRAWAEAEQLKRELEDQLAGRVPEPDKPEVGKTIADAVELFLKDKKVQGVCANVTYKYTRELGGSSVTVKLTGWLLSRASPASYSRATALRGRTYTRAQLRGPRCASGSGPSSVTAMRHNGCHASRKSPR